MTSRGAARNVTGDLGQFAGKAVRLQVAMQDADLFAWELTCAPDEET